VVFPLTYLIHIVEEYYAGVGFPEWSAQYLGFALTPERFLQLNGIGWIGMAVASLVAVRRASARWLVVPLGAVTVLNGCAHTIASIVTESYSPGVASGLALWVPLGGFTLHRSYQDLPGRLFWFGIVLGSAVHGMITLLAAAV
jgi:hypothetical protein